MLFRLSRIVQGKFNIFKKRFPTDRFREIQDTEIEQWFQKEFKGIFLKKEDRVETWQNFNLETSKLEERIHNFKQGNRLFFRYKWFLKSQLGDWNYNVKSQKEQPLIHWTELDLLDKERGDIKFIWEKSKFLEIQDFLVYDLTTSKANTDYILSEILDWIKNNPVNVGPNWACSQEISLRLINWLMFISFYKNTLYKNRYEDLKTIIRSIVEQIIHVKENINYSKISVRNNHAFSELLALYLVGDMFGCIKEISGYKQFGYKGFIKEFEFQIFNDGTDSQYSINYYRTKLQLTSIFISQNQNPSSFLSKYKSKLDAMVDFFSTVIVDKSGQVPNYGANDGSLYFRFNEVEESSNFLPQIITFAKLINSKHFPYDTSNALADDYLWFTNKSAILKPEPTATKHMRYFKDSGYLIFNKQGTYAFIRLGNHRFRPSQSDNTHIDLWKNGNNILSDSGTYSYNLSKDENYDFGKSHYHNVLLVNDDSQMKSFLNFILLDWTSVSNVNFNHIEHKNQIEVSGILSAYKHINNKLKIKRTFVLDYKKSTLLVTDSINTLDNISSITHNFISKRAELVKAITSKDTKGQLSVMSSDIEISNKYGNLTVASRFTSKSTTKQIETLIQF